MNTKEIIKKAKPFAEPFCVLLHVKHRRRY